MKRNIVIWVLWLAGMLSAGEVMAQGQMPFVRNEDGTITFTYCDTTARSVHIRGNCVLGEEDLSFAGLMQEKTMEEVDDGVWQWTTQRVLEPDMYVYQYVVNGKRKVDPANADSIWVRDKRFSVLIVPGNDFSSLYTRTEPKGTTEYVRFTDSLGTTFRMWVYLPYGYDSTQVYPVVYMLHGINGDHRNWSDQGRATVILDNLIARGEIQPVVAVMPRCLLKEPKHEDHVESTNIWNYPEVCSGKWEQRFGEIEDYIGAHYAVRDTGNAILGLSCGARQALNISNLYPGHYRYLGLFSPDIERKHLPNREVADGMRPRLWLAVGIHDDMFYMHTIHYVHNLTDMGWDYEMRLTRAGHHYVNWRRYLVWFMRWAYPMPHDPCEDNRNDVFF